MKIIATNDEKPLLDQDGAMLVAVIGGITAVLFGICLMVWSHAMYATWQRHNRPVTYVQHGTVWKPIVESEADH